MAQNITLNQCPFCGAWPKMKGISDMNVVVCTKCQSMSAVYTTVVAAAKAWNRRARNV